MVLFGSDQITNNQVKVNFDEMGVVNMTRLSGLPYYSIYYNQKALMEKDKQVCGDVNCWEWLGGGVNFWFEQVTQEITDGEYDFN